MCPACPPRRQILGLGRTGHIGFNEKGSSRASTTRLITLDRWAPAAVQLGHKVPRHGGSMHCVRMPAALDCWAQPKPTLSCALPCRVTRVDAASDFFGESNVPRRAITMGVATILASRRIILMAFGKHGRRGGSGGWSTMVRAACRNRAGHGTAAASSAADTGRLAGQNRALCNLQARTRRLLCGRR